MHDLETQSDIRDDPATTEDTVDMPAATAEPEPLAGTSRPDEDSGYVPV